MAGADYAGEWICPRTKRYGYMGYIEYFDAKGKEQIFNFQKGLPFDHENEDELKKHKCEILKSWRGGYFFICSIELEGDIYYLLVGYSAHIEDDTLFFYNEMKSINIRAHELLKKHL